MFTINNSDTKSEAAGPPPRACQGCGREFSSKKERYCAWCKDKMRELRSAQRKKALR